LRVAGIVLHSLSWGCRFCEVLRFFLSELTHYKLHLSLTKNKRYKTYFSSFLNFGENVSVLHLWLECIHQKNLFRTKRKRGGVILSTGHRPVVLFLVLWKLASQTGRTSELREYYADRPWLGNVSMGNNVLSIKEQKNG